MFLFGVFTFLVLQNTIVSYDTSSWTFLGHEYLAVLLPYIPTVMGVVICAIPTYIIAEEVH